MSYLFKMFTALRSKHFAFLAVGLLAGPMAESAAVFSSLDRAAFQDAVAEGTIIGQDFDVLTPGTILTSFDGVTYSASAGSVLVTNSFLTSTFPNGVGSTSIGFFLPTETATFSFDEPITAFAIDINTFANSNGAYFAVLDTGDFVSSIFDVFPGSITGQFIGFLSNTPFSSVTIVGLDGFSYTLDTLAYGDGAAILLQQLDSAVSGVGPGNSLANKVAHAQAFNVAKDYQATCAMLNAFQNEVRGAQRGKKLAAELADQLTAHAQAIIEVIGCD
jgi:hypothetical protein